MSAPLRIISPDRVALLRTDPVDAETLEIARTIVDDVRGRGEAALREHGVKLGDLPAADAPIIVPPETLEAARDRLDGPSREVLERVAERVARFAGAQRESIKDFSFPIPGGVACQQVSPVERAGCYAPGGRFPLPSSVIMTAVTARAAGVSEVWVASPKPSAVTLAAAAISKVDGLIAVGGAQGVAAMAFGAGPIPACDVIVGPGNRFVTAAKQLVSGRVRIDMLAGPSELTVLADDTADPEVVAADLLAQAEHDPDAVPILVSPSAALIDAVNGAVAAELEDLPTADTARQAVKNGLAVLVSDMAQGVDIVNALAPEHLELHVRDAAKVAESCRHFGALFIGTVSAEVMGDYGAGPNHTLPTSGTARHSGGLSVFDFLRIRTTLTMDRSDAAADVARDAVALARLEGLEAHARAALKRLPEEG